jgi:hypothetical protein
MLQSSPQSGRQMVTRYVRRAGRTSFLEELPCLDVPSIVLTGFLRQGVREPVVRHRADVQALWDRHLQNVEFSCKDTRLCSVMAVQAWGSGRRVMFWDILRCYAQEHLCPIIAIVGHRNDFQY